MVTLSPRVGRLRADNPSPMTLDGTNGYVLRVGPNSLVAIDPGPLDDRQRDAFVAAAHREGASYAAILVTHGHPDHAPGAAPLAAATGAPVFAHPAARFAHDRALGDDEVLRFDDAAITVLHAPGHAPDHCIFVLEAEAALFTGDAAPPARALRRRTGALRRTRTRGARRACQAR